MVEVEGGHEPFEILHCKMLVPVPIAVAGLAAEVGEEMLATPLITVHSPAPIVGVLADKVRLGLFAHKVWLAPATAGEGI